MIIVSRKASREKMFIVSHKASREKNDHSER